MIDLTAQAALIMHIAYTLEGVKSHELSSEYNLSHAQRI